VSKNRKTLFVIGGLTAGLVVTAAVLYFVNHDSKPATTTQDQSTTVPETASETPTPSGGQSAPSGQAEKDQAAQAGSQSQTSSFTLTLTRAGQLQPGGSVQIRALIEGATSGNCQVSFAGPGTTFSKTSAITFDGRIYSCGALNAAASEFSQAGNWKYVLQATNGSAKSNAVAGTVEVTK
jgi:hypothetical protein